MIPNSNNIQTNSENISSSNPLQVSQSTALSSSLDSININKMGHGSTITALNAVTATTTSDEIQVGIAGFKHIRIELLAASFSSGNFVVSITGSEVSAGTFGPISILQDAGTYAAVGNMTISTNTKAIYILPNISVNYIKVTGTRTTDGTLTVKVTPFN